MQLKKSRKSDRSSIAESYEKIRLYNFRIPNRFTKDQLRVLRGIYDNFSAGLASHLSVILRKFCQVELISVEEHTFSEFYNAILDPVLLAIINISGTQGTTLMEISPSIGYGIIDRLLGGPGKSSSQSRSYTEIEVALIEKLVGQFLEIMADSWARFHTIEPRLERIEIRSQFAQIAPPNETIAIATFSLKMGEVEGMINYCIPHVVVEPFFKDIKLKNEFIKKTEVKVEDSKADIILNKINKSQMDLIAQFNDTSIPAGEIMNIKVGDVLVLDHKVNEPVNLFMNNTLKFRGIIGTKKGKLSVKISEKLKENEE